MKASIITYFLLCFSFIEAKPLVLALPMQEKDAYALLSRAINHAKTRVDIYTPSYDYKRLNYYLIKKASEDISINLIVAQKEQSTLLAELMLYEHIHVCFAIQPLNKTSIIIDSKTLFETSLPLSDSHFQNGSSTLRVRKTIDETAVDRPECDPYFAR